ncbi:hypothetical protein ACHAQA_001724, partial [Verticillium albo-atrum]
CSLLRAELSSKVITPGVDNATAIIEPYYAGQAQDMTPGCIVLATTSEDVSTAVRILSAGFRGSPESCDFAIRSGGHSPGIGTNNIDGGVTLDLSNLNVVLPSEDGSQVSVGPGNRWEDVYSVLDPLGIAVLGGRSRTVGVGGLLLSGGMSFFSARYGLPCDNVLNYEIVLASGEIVNANNDSHPDLYKALKGGSNNYGVVTRFDLRAFSIGDFWGGTAMYNASALPDLLDKFSDFDNSDNYDPYSQLTLLYGRAGDKSIVMTHQHYTKPEAPPESVFGALAPFQVSQTFRIDSLKNFTVELEAKPDGGKIRKAFATATFKNNLEMLRRFQVLADDTMTLLGDVPGFLFVVSMQPFGQFITGKSDASGGNLLGLDAGDGDRVLICLTVDWHDKADDEMVEAEIQKLVEEAYQQAEALDAVDDFVFQNYAAPWQDVYGGVGEENLEVFRKVSRVYDPLQVFQKAVLGGFKL